MAVEKYRLEPKEEVDSPEWTAPTECDQCAHPISEHTLWTPDYRCGGWMHCTAQGCDKCWHDWPKLTDTTKSSAKQGIDSVKKYGGNPADASRATKQTRFCASSDLQPV